MTGMKLDRMKSIGAALAGLALVAALVPEGNGKWERHASAAPDQLFGESMVMGDFDGDGHPGFATSTSVMDRHDT
jgi:hypothetical protein